MDAPLWILKFVGYDAYVAVCADQDASSLSVFGRAGEAPA